MDNTKEKFQIVDEHWQFFEDISQNIFFGRLVTHQFI